MSNVRIHVGLSAAQLKKLDALAHRLGLDRTNAVRYCIARTIEAEDASPPPAKEIFAGSK